MTPVIDYGRRMYYCCNGFMASESLLDHPTIGARYFFPRPGRVPDECRHVVEVNGATLICALFPPPPGGLVVVHFHGNGEVAADWVDVLPAWLAEQRCGVLLAEFRGYGGSTGTPALGQMLDDVGALVRAAGVPPERVVLFGRSVGSIFALEAADLFPLAVGLVLESAIADPLERLLLRMAPDELGVTREALAAEVDRRLDQHGKIGRYPGPVLVLHTLHDNLVPVSHGERLAAWARGPVTLQTFPRGDHNSILMENQGAYLGALEHFLAGLRSATG
jgi:pimeloyl-ACP methyl ester carboxylesterase